MKKNLVADFIYFLAKSFQVFEKLIISHTLLKTISLFPSTVLATNQCMVIDSGVKYNKTFI